MAEVTQPDQPELHTCSAIDCAEPATLHVRAEAWTDDGIMMVVMWSGWERFGPNPEGRGMYCELHAIEVLSRTPILRPGREDAPTGNGKTFAHG